MSPLHPRLGIRRRTFDPPILVHGLETRRPFISEQSPLSSAMEKSVISFPTSALLVVADSLVHVVRVQCCCRARYRHVCVSCQLL